RPTRADFGQTDAHPRHAGDKPRAGLRRACGWRRLGSVPRRDPTDRASNQSRALEISQSTTAPSTRQAAENRSTATKSTAPKTKQRRNQQGPTYGPTPPNTSRATRTCTLPRAASERL